MAFALLFKNNIFFTLKVHPPTRPSPPRGTKNLKKNSKKFKKVVSKNTGFCYRTAPQDKVLESTLTATPQYLLSYSIVIPFLYLKLGT